MKRFFTFSLLLLGSWLVAVAQQAEFRFGGVAVAEGATVTIAAEEDEWGDIICESNAPSNPSQGLILANLTSNVLNGRATLTVTSNTMQTSRLQWCMGGECVIMNTNAFDKNYTVPAGGFTLTQFDALPTQYGELTATLSVLVGLERHSVNIRFVYADPAAPLTFERRSVVEEFTGTWCGNCTRGIVGMRNLAREFGDRFIGIAVHSSTNSSGAGEPMYNKAYHTTGVVPTGIPKCTIDRAVTTHPYEGTTGGTHYGLNKDFAAALAVPAEAKVEVTAKWENANRNYIVCTAQTTFGMDSQTAPYALIFVITEDGLHGEGKEWAQVNYYATETNRTFTDADMDEMYAAPYYITDMTYDHVALASLGVRNGEPGSITAPIVKGQAQTFTGRVMMRGNTIMQNPYNLTAVAMLVNTSTGAIVNANTAPVESFDGDAITAPRTDQGAQRHVVYDLSGRQIANATWAKGSMPRGVYVVDGRKVVVK